MTLLDYEKIKEIKLEENKLYKIILVGKRNFEINTIEIYKYLIFFKINTFLSVSVYSVKEGICINKKLSVAMLILSVSLLFCKDKHLNSQKNKQKGCCIWLWA